jgi:hypothetical protein
MTHPSPPPPPPLPLPLPPEPPPPAVVAANKDYLRPLPLSPLVGAMLCHSPPNTKNVCPDPRDVRNEEEERDGGGAQA